MFCFYCGQQIPDGSAVCPKCGGALTNARAQQPQQYAQQPQQYAQQPQQYAQQPQQYAQQPQQYAQQPQQYAQQPQQYAQQAQQYAQQAQQYAQQPQQYAQQPQQYAQLPQPYMQRPQQPVYNAGYATTPKPKKKPKVGLIAGLSCGGAAIATTAIVVANTAQPGLLRTFMGEENYAKSVQTTYLGDLYNDVTSYGGMLTSAGNVAGAATGKMTRMNRSYDYENYSRMSERYSYNTINLAQNLYPYMEAFNNADMKNVTLTMGFTAELGDELKRLIQNNAGSSASQVLEMVEKFAENASSLQVKLASSADDKGYAVQLSLLGDNSEFAGAVMHLSKDGDLRISFPGMTDKVITAKLPTYEEMGFEKASGDAGAKFDVEKAREFGKKITEAYYRGYKFGTVSYSDETVAFGSDNVGCTVVTVTMDNKALAEALNAVADVLENDKYAAEVLEYFGITDPGSEYNNVTYYAERIRDMVTYSLEGDRAYKYTLVTENYVNGANNSLGVRFRLKRDGREVFRYEDLDNGNYIGKRLVIGDNKIFSIEGKHGDVDISFNAHMLYYYLEDVTLNVKYSNISEFDAFGTRMKGGDFKISLKDYKLYDSGYYNYEEVMDIVKKGEITLSLNGQDGGYKLSLGVDVKGYGSASVNYSLVPSADIPGDSSGGNSIDFSDFDSYASQELTQELLDAIKSKADSNKGAKVITDMFILPVVNGYALDAKITSADSTASTLKDTMNTFITDMDVKNAGVKRTSEAVLCTLTVRSAYGTYDMDNITFEISGGASALLSDRALDYGGGYGGSGWIDAFRQRIYNDYNFKEDITAQFWMKNGMCIGVSYYTGSDGYSFRWPDAESFQRGKWDGWGDKDGVLRATGEVMGTNPKLISGYDYY